jgi:hypothetical protein
MGTARFGDVLRSILSRARAAATGSRLGLAVYGVSAIDPTTVASVVRAVDGSLPGCRAARIEPTVLLRYEKCTD